MPGDGRESSVFLKGFIVGLLQRKEIEMDNLWDFYHGEIPGYVVSADEESFTLNIRGVLDERIELVVTVNDVAEYFATQARSMSGMRSLAGHYGDWRQIDQLAQEVLSWFKFVNIEGMRKASLSLGLIPKF